MKGEPHGYIKEYSNSDNYEGQFLKAGHTDMVLTDLKKMNCLIDM